MSCQLVFVQAAGTLFTDYVPVILWLAQKPGMAKAWRFASIVGWGMGHVLVEPPGKKRVLAVMIVMIAYALKAVDEERFLAQQLSDYPAYQQRVPRRLIPWLW